jgi:hypothetical protein
MAQKLTVLRWNGVEYLEIFTLENIQVDSLNLSLSGLGDCSLYVDELPKLEPVKESCKHVFPINGGECLKCGESEND